MRIDHLKHYSDQTLANLAEAISMHIPMFTNKVDIDCAILERDMVLTEMRRRLEPNHERLYIS